MEIEMKSKSEIKERELHYSWVKVSVLRSIIFYTLCVLSGGLLVILCINYPTIRLKMISYESSGAEADFVHVIENGEEDIYTEVERSTAGRVF